MDKDAILKYLPYSKPFLFVDEILHVDENSVKGTFTFDGQLDFYKGHFIDNPITPGVILIETMAQIGLVSLGIYLTFNEKPTHFAFTTILFHFYNDFRTKNWTVFLSGSIY